MTDWISGLCLFLTIILAVAKLAGWLIISWWIVFMPLLLLLIYIVIMLIIVIIIGGVAFSWAKKHLG